MAGSSRTQGLTDTDILIDGARNLPEGVEFLSSLVSSKALRISIVSAMELVLGCRDKTELQKLHEFVVPINAIPISEPISNRAFDLLSTFYLSHGLLIPDALIAATALEHGLKLYTRNLKHFDMIPGLSVEKPY
jgi:predicted nucleic acid-binding protein